MRNVTITMDEEVARWARIEAARRDTSLARFVGDVLRAQMHEDSAYETAMEAFLAVKPRARSGGNGLPSRDEVYDRAALRR